MLRWTTYVAKLIVVTAMAASSAVILVGCMLAEARFLNWLNAGVGSGGAAPVALIARQAAEMTGLAFLFLTIQHWVSLRWRTFSVSIGFGFVAMVTGFATALWVC